MYPRKIIFLTSSFLWWKINMYSNERIGPQTKPQSFSVLVLGNFGYNDSGINWRFLLEEYLRLQFPHPESSSSAHSIQTQNYFWV